MRGGRFGFGTYVLAPYFFALVTMNGEAAAAAGFLSAFGLRTSLLDFF